ncbi:hypothetical protein TSMEX_008000 [Taenia solium]|eukprot:TsM_000251600 transcript=TsM_000251600 gene=TsM_000251600
MAGVGRQLSMQATNAIVKAVKKDSSGNSKKERKVTCSKSPKVPKSSSTMPLTSGSCVLDTVK